jgi:GMP reductase
MNIETTPKLDFSDVLLRPKRSDLTSRKDVSLSRTFKFYHSTKTWSGVPIMTANMHSCGTFEMAKALSKEKIITILHKHYSVEELERFCKTWNQPQYLGYSLGIRDEDFEKLNEILAKNLQNSFDFICLDVPNAYLERVQDKVTQLRNLLPDHIIIAGNVVTNEMTQDLIKAGADIVKVGIGSGSVCLTRKQTGVGYPQLSAVMECADAAHGITKKHDGAGYGLIISDGGITCNGDIGKAFCGGADFVMCGSLFSGFTQSGGELVTKDGKQYKQYFGSSSTKAMLQNYGKVEKHRSSEGRETLIPYKGDIEIFIEDMFGAMRSTGTYIGARTIKEFHKCATFILVHQQLNTSLAKYDD